MDPAPDNNKNNNNVYKTATTTTLKDVTVESIILLHKNFVFVQHWNKITVQHE